MFRNTPSQRRKILKGVLYASLGLAICMGVLTIYCFTKFSAMVDHRLKGDFKSSARIYAAAPVRGNSAVDDEAALMTNFFDAARAKKKVIHYEDIPKVLIAAILSGEDYSFFQHYGLNPKRIAGALVADIKDRGPSQGGSTITQQLARSLFLNREPTLRRKVSEAVIAVILEHRLSKEEIFTMYANEVYLGQRDSFAIHGFAEAAKAYFGKELQALTLSEAATLAGIIPGPNKYSPAQHPERAIARCALILRAMLESNEITQAEYDQARKAELKIAPSLDPAEGHYVIDYIQEELRREFSEEALMSDGLNVYTTVDLPLQRAAIDAVVQGLTSVEKQLAKRRRSAGKSRSHAAPQAGLIAIDPRTGEIKAMVGGADYGETQYNRITQALRQPGSIFKPIVYAAALELARDGYSRFDVNTTDEEGPDFITPLTMLLDEPTAFSAPGAPVYSPRNYGGKYSGPVTLRTAFHRSLNIPTVLLAQAVGYDRVVSMARRLGLNPQIRAYPSVALGAFEVTPMEMARAYTAFANGGQRVEPHAIRKVVSNGGVDLKTYKTQKTNALSPQLAYLMTHLMEGVVNYGTGGGIRSRGFWLPAAGKTGTSRDGWFAGYTKDLLVITWVGFDDGHDLNLEGARSALPIWAEFMKKAYEIHPVRDASAMAFAPPTGIEVANIDSATLLLSDHSCGESFDEAFMWGTAPTASCTEVHP